MDYLIICLVALAASGLTLFSGFGLGTLLMPAFALFFPVPTAMNRADDHAATCGSLGCAESVSETLPCGAICLE